MACVYGHIQSPEGEVGCPQASVVGGCDLAMKSTLASWSQRVSQSHTMQQISCESVMGVCRVVYEQEYKGKDRREGTCFCRGI